MSGEGAKPRALTLGCGKLLKLVEVLLGYSRAEFALFPEHEAHRRLWGAAVAAYVLVGHHSEEVDVKAVVARAFEHEELALFCGGLRRGFGLLFGGGGDCCL